MTGHAEQFSGGIPFLPHELNVKIARALFAGVPLLCGLILISGPKQLRKLTAEK